MRYSEVFSVCGLPDVKVVRAKDKKYQVELLGMDVFDPSNQGAVNRLDSPQPSTTQAQPAQTEKP
jgi:hypothetical protein